MIGIAIPAHNEEKDLPGCLRSIAVAARHPALRGESVSVVVALDDCSDGTAAVCESFGVAALKVHSRNVGAARAAAAEWLIGQGARWLCCTDADTMVSRRWIVEQLALKSDAVCGTVGVQDWGVRGSLADVARRAFTDNYHDRDDHRHIHGANLGVCVRAYEAAGGFQPLRCSEDVALVEALTLSGASIAWSARPRVFTSARINARASGGFGDTLTTMAQSALAICPA